MAKTTDKNSVGVHTTEQSIRIVDPSELKHYRDRVWYFNPHPYPITIRNDKEGIILTVEPSQVVEGRSDIVAPLINNKMLMPLIKEVVHQYIQLGYAGALRLSKMLPDGEEISSKKEEPTIRDIPLSRWIEIIKSPDRMRELKVGKGVLIQLCRLLKVEPPKDSNIDDLCACILAKVADTGTPNI